MKIFTSKTKKYLFVILVLIILIGGSLVISVVNTFNFKKTQELQTLFGLNNLICFSAFDIQATVDYSLFSGTTYDAAVYRIRDNNTWGSDPVASFRCKQEDYSGVSSEYVSRYHEFDIMANELQNLEALSEHNTDLTVYFRFDDVSVSKSSSANEVYFTLQRYLKDMGIRLLWTAMNTSEAYQNDSMVYGVPTDVRDLYPTGITEDLVPANYMQKVEATYFDTSKNGIATCLNIESYFQAIVEYLYSENPNDPIADVYEYIHENEMKLLGFVVYGNSSDILDFYHAVKAESDNFVFDISQLRPIICTYILE